LADKHRRPKNDAEKAAKCIANFALSTGVKQWSSQKSGTRYTRNMVPEHHI
jgi:hypothetical protein